MINIHYASGMPTFVDTYPFGMVLTNALSSLDSIKSGSLAQGEKYAGQTSVSHEKGEGDLFINPYHSYTNAYRQPDGKYRIELAGLTTPHQLYTRTIVERLPGTALDVSRFVYSTYNRYEHMTVNDQVYDQIYLLSYGRVVHNVYTLAWTTLPNGHQQLFKTEHIATRENFRVPDGQSFDSITRSQMESFIASPDTLYEGTSKASYGPTSPYVYYNSQNWTPVMNVREIRASAHSILRSLSSRDLPVVDSTWGDLSMRAANNRFAIDANFIESILGLLQMKTLIKTFLKKVKHLRDIPKDVANKFLALSYGVLPMQSDIEAIINGINKVPHLDGLGFRVESASARASAGNDYVIRRVHLALKGPDPSITNPLRNVGLALTPKNIWETIPYSFVIDWFVDISALLDDVQTHSDFLSLPVAYSLSSEKTHRREVLNDKAVTGHIGLTTYSRYVSPYPPQPNYIGSSMSSISADKHWLEGAALIMSAKLK